MGKADMSLDGYVRSCGIRRSRQIVWKNDMPAASDSKGSRDFAETFAVCFSWCLGVLVVSHFHYTFLAMASPISRVVALPPMS